MSHGHIPLGEEEVSMPRGHSWNKLWIIALVLSLVGWGASFALMGQAPSKQFWFSYLTSFLFWLSLSIGGLFFVIVQFAAKAGWSVVVRRLAEHLMIGIWIFAILFVPIALGGMHDLYEWTHISAHGGGHGDGHAAAAGDHGKKATPKKHIVDDPEAYHEKAHHEVLEGKTGYLNAKFFKARAVGYFLIWLILAFFFYRGSVGQDKDGDIQRTRKMQKVSGPSILLFALTVTFAAFDWIMSLDPGWYSTIYGAYFFSGSVVAVMAFLSLISIAMNKARLLQSVITIEHYHDLGKLLFAFVVFWTYIAFSQYFLIWYSNIPEETAWYAKRVVGSWETVSILIMLGHFIVPFFYLLSRHTKRNIPALAVAATWMLFIHFVDIFWLVQPHWNKEGAHVHVLDVTLFVAMGGLFMAVFFKQLQRHALIPKRDPRLQESLSFENI